MKCKQFKKLYVKPLGHGFGLRRFFCSHAGLGREAAQETPEATGWSRLHVPPTRKFSPELYVAENQPTFLNSSEKISHPNCDKLDTSVLEQYVWHIIHTRAPNPNCNVHPGKRAILHEAACVAGSCCLEVLDSDKSTPALRTSLICCTVCLSRDVTDGVQ